MGEEAEKPKPVAEFSGLWVEDEDDFVEFAHYAQAEALTSTEDGENWEEDWEDEDPNDTFLNIKSQMVSMQH